MRLLPAWMGNLKVLLYVISISAAIVVRDDTRGYHDFVNGFYTLPDDSTRVIRYQERPQSGFEAMAEKTDEKLDKNDDKIRYEVYENQDDVDPDSNDNFDDDDDEYGFGFSEGEDEYERSKNRKGRY